MFGQAQATTYLYELEKILEDLAERPLLARDASFIAHQLKHYNYRAHVIFYEIENENEIYVVRIMGKRMNFIEHF